MININESSRMSAYIPVTSDKQIQNLQKNELNSMSRNFSAINQLLSPLSDEEKEQQLNTVDNGVKTTDVLNRSENSGATSEQIGVTSGWDERHRFIEKLYNVTFDEFQKLNTLENGVTFGSGLNITTGEAPESTPENPIMYVASGNADVEPLTLTWYKVYVNQVNPSSATREEMLALITHTYRDSEEALLQATYAWHDMDPCALNNGDNGRIDFMKELQCSFALNERVYKGGDMRAKNAYEALLDMIDRFEKRADQQTKPSQTNTLYHQIAAEKAKMEVQ